MHGTENRTRIGRQGFTLIELLVVVSIVALLVALLLPAMTAAREAVNRTVCAANLHQFSTVLVAYAADSDGLYPGPAGAHSFQPSHFYFKTQQLLMGFPLTQYYGDRNRFWYCPNLAEAQDTFGPGALGQGGSGWVLPMGYQYLANPTPPTRWPGWGRAPHAPRGPTDPGEWNVMNDWNALQPGWHIQVQGIPWHQGYPSHTYWAVVVGHVPGGGGVNAAHLAGTEDPRGSDGGNQLYNDGSAAWANFIELTPVWSVPTNNHYWVYR